MLKPHIKVVDEFLNHLLIPNSVGKAFVDFYHTYSPHVANFIAKHDTVRLIVRWSLLPIVGLSWMALHCGVWMTLAAVVLLICLTYAGTRFVLRRMQFRHQA